MGEPWTVLVETLKKQEREAVRLRELGKFSAAIEQFRVAVNICDDAVHRFGRGSRSPRTKSATADPISGPLDSCR